MQKLLSKTRNFCAQLAADPARASKTVFTAFTLVAFTSFAWQAQLNATALQSKILALKTVEARKSELQASGQLDSIISACAASRKAGDAGKLMKAVAFDFRGVVPGISELLNNYPSDTKNRKDKLIFEVVTRYGNLKYCLARPNFTQNPKKLSEADLAIALGAYFQVQLAESGKLTAEERARLGKLNIDNAILDKTKAEVAKDLSDTENAVREIVEQAVASAEKIDGKTEAKTDRNMNRSQNLGEGDAAEWHTQTYNIAGRDAEINDQTLQRIGNIEKILASFQAGTPGYKTVLKLPKKEAITPEERALVGITRQNNKEELAKKIAKGAKENVFSGGLLNLLDPEILEAKKDWLKEQKTLFIAAQKGVDVLNPEQNGPVPPSEADFTPRCPAIDSPEGRGICFGF